MNCSLLLSSFSVGLSITVAEVVHFHRKWIVCEILFSEEQKAVVIMSRVIQLSGF